jgi:uncharacterized protein involved in exopolysaccharide biosynthesis
MISDKIINKKFLKSFLKFFIPSFFIFFMVILFLPKYYKSEFKIISYASSSSSSSSLADLAASVGMSSISGLSSDQSIVIHIPEVMKSVIKSQKFRTKLLDQKISTHQFSEYTLREIYTEHYNIKSSKKINDIDFKINKKLDNHIDIQKDRITNILMVSVETFDRELAQSMAKLISKMLEDQTIEFSTQITKDQIEFIKSRLIQVNSELIEDEENLNRFQTANKTISSPSLQLQLSRLNREVSMKTSVYISLNTQLEGLEVQLVEQSADLFFIEDPTFPYKKSWPNRTSLLVLMTINLFIISSGIVYLRKFIFKN